MKKKILSTLLITLLSISFLACSKEPVFNENQLPGTIFFYTNRLRKTIHDMHVGVFNKGKISYFFKDANWLGGKLNSDTKEILFASNDQWVATDVQGKVLWTKSIQGIFSVNFVWFPDGEKVIAITQPQSLSVKQYKQSIRIFDFKSDTQTLLVAGGAAEDYFAGVSVSPDAKNVVYSKEMHKADGPPRENDIIEINLDKKNESHVLTRGQDPVYSPDGKQIAFLRGAVDKKGRVEYMSEVFIYDRETKKEKRITHDGLWRLYLQYSPDGKYLLYGANNHLYALDIKTRKSYKLFPEGRVPISQSSEVSDGILDWAA